MRPDRTLLPILFALAAAQAQAQPFTFTRVVGSGDVMPGTTEPLLGIDEAPGLHRGHVAFIGFRQTPTGPVSTIFSNASGTFQPIASTGDTMPGTSVPLEFVIRLAIDDDDVAFTGSSFVGGIARNAIITNASGALVDVVDENDFIPGGPSKFQALSAQDFSFGHGVITFNGSGSSSFRGVYAVNALGGPVARIADSTMVAPGGSQSFFTFGRTATRDDRVTFYSNVGGQLSLFEQVGVGAGAVTRLVSWGDLAPSGPPFTFLFNPKVDEEGTVFYGIAGGVRGIHAIVNGSMITVADTNTPNPSGPEVFGEFGEYAISNDRVVLEAQSSNGEIVQQIGLYTNVCGSLARIVGPGDVLDGKTVLLVRMDEDSLDEDRLAFTAYFTDGSAAVYIADLTAIDHSAIGFAPAGGVVPTLEAVGCPAFGAPLIFQLRRGTVGALGLLVIGAAPASIPLGTGGMLLAQPDWVGLSIGNAPTYGRPDAWFDCAVTVPNDLSLSGQTFSMQGGWQEPSGAWRLTDRLEVPIP